jgi:hypothetical protein
MKILNPKGIYFIWATLWRFSTAMTRKLAT